MDEAFGTLLRRARQRVPLTLEGLAEKSGVSVRAISDMERGRSVPRPATLRELLDALDLEGEERQRLTHTATGSGWRAPQQLPPDLAVFRGREEALAAVHALTARTTEEGGHVVISAIGGMGGVGKTTLAVHWAHQVADRFPDGQLYVNLRGFENSGTPLNPGEALGTFLGALGVAGQDMPRGTEARSALFRERIASRRLIVVLDNARDAEHVRPLLPSSPGCLTIITSRDRLAGLAAVEGASLIGLNVWTPEEAMTALAARIGDARCAAEPEAAEELIRLCGYLPLAIAVIGAQLSAEPRMRLRVAVRELREAQPRLDALASDDRRVDVRAVFSWSYRALSAQAARFFTVVAMHPGSAVSAEAAASLAGLTVPEARRHLRELTAASLLSHDADGRYVLHDLVRAYGAELVEPDSDERFDAVTRLLDYLRHNAYVANRFVNRYPQEPASPTVPGIALLDVAGREEALDWFRQEESTLSAAVRALDDPRLSRSRIGCSLEWSAYHREAGRWGEETESSRIALDAALVLDDPVAIARSSTNLSVALAETGRLDEAGEVTELMLGQLDRLPPREQLLVERYASRVHSRQGRMDEGLRHAQRSVEIAREVGEPWDIARSTAILGWFHAALGRHDLAISTCEEALVLLRETGNRHDEAGVRGNIGYIRQRQGDLHGAVADYREALRIYEEVFERYNTAEVLADLASAQLELGDVEQARANWTRAADLFDTLRVARAAPLRAKAEALPPPA